MARGHAGLISELLANRRDDAPLIECPDRLQFLDRQLMDDNLKSHGPIITAGGLPDSARARQP
jgi:hypothetical protein